MIIKNFIQNYRIDLDLLENVINLMQKFDPVKLQELNF